MCVCGQSAPTLSDCRLFLSNLKHLQVDCKPVNEKAIDKFVEFIFANSKIKEITINYLSEEIHFLSPSQTIETVMIVKASVNELPSHIPIVHMCCHGE